MTAATSTLPDVETSDALLGTVAAVLPVFMLAAMFELSRVVRPPRPKGWTPLAVVETIAHWLVIIGCWALILALAAAEILSVWELARPVEDRTRGASAAVTFVAFSVVLLLLTTAFGAMARWTAQSAAEKPSPARLPIARGMRPRTRASRALRR